MFKIPDKYLKRIPEGLIIEWAGRKKFFEVIEELWDSLWYILVFLWFIRILYYFEVIDINSWQVQIAASLVIIVLSLPAWLEFERWLAEYHVVARHSDRDGGVIYKFDGILNPSMEPINIAPTMDMTITEYKNNILYTIWVWFTKSRMEKVQLKTAPTRFILADKRIDPGYSAAIGRVQHSPAPHRMSKDIPFWANVDGLIRAKNSGGLDEYEFRDAVRNLVQELTGRKNDVV